MSTTTEGLALLRQPFPDNQISYLPKGGAKLAYVGHAALTDRLLDADPAWTWEPLSLDSRGLPALDEHGGLWIKLTVCGITRLGYGDAGQKKGGDAMKERIGDALRNAAMRFGAALDLWHKGELHAHQDERAEPPAPTAMPSDVLADWLGHINESHSTADVKQRLSEGKAVAEECGDTGAYAQMVAAAKARAKEITDTLALGREVESA
jgi:hypothetical protein